MEPSYVVHTAEEERRHIAEVWDNPHIVQAYKQVEQEIGFLDVLFDKLGIKAIDHGERIKDHLDAADRKLFEDFQARKIDASSAAESEAIASAEIEGNQRFSEALRSTGRNGRGR